MIEPSWPPIARDLVDPPADLVAELVHLHHAGRDAVLHLLDHPLDVEGGHGGLVGESADLAGDDEESEAVFAGLLGLDRRVDRQQVGLVGDLGDGGDGEVDVRGPLR